MKIIVAKARKLRGPHSLFVSFQYDPALVDLMRSFTPRFYSSSDRTWELPVECLDFIRANSLKESITVENEELAQISKYPMSNSVKFEFKTKPYRHQVDCFNYAQQHSRFLLGDEQGLGKTKEVIDIAVNLKNTCKFKHCLIICGVNGLKYNWAKEVGIHSNEKAWILGTRKNKIGTIQDRYEDLLNLDSIDAYFLITNVETIRANNSEKKGRKTIRDFYLAKKIQQLIEQGVIGLVAFDEIHKCKDPDSLQGQALLKIKPELGIAMSGTLLMNSPLDLYVPLAWLGFEQHSFWAFKNHYCLLGGFGNKQVVGYKNTSELRNLVDRVMLRRKKEEVLDLPPKINMVEYVEMDRTQRSIYNEVASAIKNEVDKIRLSPDPLSQLLRLRQVTGHPAIVTTKKVKSAKLERLKELLEDLKTSNEKAIIFSNWTSVIDPLYQELAEYNPAIITGDIKDREAEKNKFMQDPSCRVILGTIGAMGTGYTLTAASTVIFMDSPWNQGNKDQAVDRAHRIGTKQRVNVITLVAKDSIDEKIEELVYSKGRMSDLIIDGKIENNLALFNEIVKEL